jgi:hypothetical protein
VNRRQTLLIAKYSSRYSVRSGIGLVFLLLSLTFGLVVADTMMRKVVSISREIAARTRSSDPAETTRDVMRSLTQQAKPVVYWMLSSEASSAKDLASGRRSDEDAEAWADYLLDGRPAMLSAIFLILLFGWPLVVACGAFDLYAGDIGSRQLRYQLLRADRGSIFFGRLFGMLLTFVAVLVLLGVTVTVYMGCKLSVYAWPDLAAWATYGTVAMICVSVPYIALCAWLSAASSSSFFSLTMGSLVIGGLPLVAMFASLSSPVGRYLLYLLPWGFQTRLFHHEPSQVALAVGGCALQTLVFTWLGYRKFTTRDL